jgi:energy-coupling factor transport system ATP-binding protein
MIKFSGVSLLYPQATRTVLDSLTCEIAEGEMVLVMGHTGSGKSSLLRLVNGLVPHHTGGILAGEIIVDGLSTRTLRPGELAGIVGIVGQNPIDGFVADTVEEEIAFGMESLNFAPELMRKRVEEALDQVGLAHLRDRTIATLSGGEQQRVAIASALVMHPKVLLLDEPTSALDPIAAEEILALLHRLVHDLSITVIIAEHRLERVIGYVDRILLIEEDGKSHLGLPEEILTMSNLVPPIVKLARALHLPDIGTSTRDVRRATTQFRESLPDVAAPVRAFGAPTVVAENVTVQYQAKIALSNASLTLHSGEITALMGRNGAGKSSLIRSIVGVQKVSAGKISVNGKSISEYSSVERAQLIGYVPQEPGDLLFRTSVAQECAAADIESHLSPGTTLALLHENISAIDPQTHPRDLSEGQRLALVLSIVLASQPALLILDEPTRGLDYEAKERLAVYLRAIADDSATTVLIATHDVELVAELADRTIFLADGDKVADGSTIDVLLASPAFAPQVAKVMSPRRWLTVGDVLKSQQLSSQ